MNECRTHTFDVVVAVRRRVCVSGPDARDLAREMIKGAILGGISMYHFAKRDEAGHPIERLVSNDFTLEDVEVSDASQGA